MAGIHGLGKSQKVNPSDGQQTMQRRRTPRYHFVGGVAELTDTLGQYLVAGTAQLSRFGCFVRTRTPFPAGVPISLRITYDGTEFVADSEVLYALSDKGMGLAFRSIPSGHEEVLENWLTQCAV
jgi:PilZ domain